MGFHEQVQRVMEACPAVHKWAIVDRDPLARWGEGPSGSSWRRRPSDDAIHAQGCGDLDGGRRGAGARCVEAFAR